MGRLNNKFLNTVLFGLEMEELFTDIDEWEFEYLANSLNIPIEERNFYKYEYEQNRLAHEDYEGYDPSKLVIDSNNYFV